MPLRQALTHTPGRDGSVVWVWVWTCLRSLKCLKLFENAKCLKLLENAMRPGYVCDFSRLNILSSWANWAYCDQICDQIWTAALAKLNDVMDKLNDVVQMQLCVRHSALHWALEQSASWTNVNRNKSQRTAELSKGKSTYFLIHESSEWEQDGVNE